MIVEAVLVMDTVTPERRGRALGLLSSAIGVLPVGMFVLGEFAEVVAPSTAVAATALIGGVVMTAFLRIRPEAMAQTTR